MRTRADVIVPGSDYLVSYARLLPDGVSIVDLVGYITNEFDEPVFKLCRLVLSTGDTVSIEGEHDLPYLCEDRPLPKGQLEAIQEPEDTVSG